KDENILTRSMVQTILGTAAFFVVVMMTLLIGMEWFGWFDPAWLPKGRWSEYDPGVQSHDFPELTTRQVSIFFAVYVFFQVWNQINCRSLTPEVNAFDRIWAN